MKKDAVFFSQLNFVSFNFQDVGIPFKINGVVRHFNGTIGQCLADNLGVIIWEVLWKVLMHTGDAGFAWEPQKKSNKR